MQINRIAIPCELGDKSYIAPQAGMEKECRKNEKNWLFYDVKQS